MLCMYVCGVVGGQLSYRLLHNDQVLFSSNTSLHLHRTAPAAHPAILLESSHTSDSIIKVYNPHLLPPPKYSREENCRKTAGCSYRLRAGMQSLILLATQFKVPIPPHHTEDADSETDNDQPTAFPKPHIIRKHQTTNPFRQDESMLIYATNLTLVIDSAEVIESNQLAQEWLAHDGEKAHPAAARTHEEGADADSEQVTFIAPDILLSFHQYELSPMQHAGVSLIIKGAAVLLAGIALTWSLCVSGSDRSKSKKH